MTYIVRRLLSGLLLCFALTWVTFALFWFLPAEPWRAVLPSYQYPHPTPAQIKAANHKLGVDRPVAVQYGRFVWRIVRHGDFGQTYFGSDVTASLKRVLPITWSIVGGGAVILFLLAVPLGTLSALRANGALDRAILVASIAGVALPPFIIGIGLRWLLASQLHWLPADSYCPLRGTAYLPCAAPGEMCRQPAEACGGPVDWVSHLMLPWLTFAVIFLPLYMRMIRAAVIDVLQAQYVTTARAKGAGTIRLLRSHVLRNSLLQPLTMIGMEIGLALTVSIYLETIFRLHGAGNLALGALGQTGDSFDLPLLAGIVFTIAFTVIVLNLIIDLLYSWLDPRLRVGGSAAAQPT